MVPPTEPKPPSTNEIEAQTGITITDLVVEGTIPPGLSGRLLGIGPDVTSPALGSPRVLGGTVHSVHLHDGQAVGYRSRWVMTNRVAQRLGVDATPGPPSTGPDIIDSNIVVFNGSILALGQGSLAYELSPDLDTLRRVDLAGRSRGLAAWPKNDPDTGDLHALVVDTDGTQAHVVVSAGAHTRTSRTLSTAPTRIDDLAITRDRIVFVGDGYVGVAERGKERIAWIATTATEALRMVVAHDLPDGNDAIAMYLITTSLERWTLHASTATMHREVLDPTPQQFARHSYRPTGPAPRFLWASGPGAVTKHDLVGKNSTRHNFPSGQPGDLAFVADETRSGDLDGGWLIGFVHHPSGTHTDLVVLDAADVAGPALAAVGIPRRIPNRLRTTWIPSTN